MNEAPFPSGFSRALILAGGELDPRGGQEGLFTGEWGAVIAVDRGAAHAAALGLVPDLLIGDMDSIDPAVRASYRGVPELVFPSAKEKSDTQLAVEWALEREATWIVIGGGLGGRFDHSLANAQLLALIHRRGASGVVTDGRQAVYLLVDRLTVTGPKGYALSVLPLEEGCRGLTERGLRWELNDFTPVLGDTRTLSNELTGEPAELTLKEGAAFVIVGPPV